MSKGSLLVDVRWFIRERMIVLKGAVKEKHSKSIPCHKPEKEWFSYKELWKENTPKASLVTNQRKRDVHKEDYKRKQSKSIPGHKWDKEWLS